VAQLTKHKRFNDRLNCRKVMSSCQSCSGRLFHSVGPAVAKLVTELVAWSLDQACSTISRSHRTASCPTALLSGHGILT